MHNKSQSVRLLRILPFLIVLVFLCLTTFSAKKHAPVWHEPAQLLAGLNIWKFGRFDTQQVNPPLGRVVVSAPVLAFSPKLDVGKFDRPPRLRDEFYKGEEFVKDNAGNARQLFFVARLTSLVFSLLGILCCYFFACELFGKSSGLITLLLLCFSPYILGHAPTIMNDVPTAFMAVISVYYFWRWLKRPEWFESVIAGLTLGLAVLSKFTLLVFFPLYVFLWLIYRLPDYRSSGTKGTVIQAGLLCVTFLTSIFVINAGYLGEGSFTRLADYRFKSLSLTEMASLDEVPFAGANRFEGTMLGKIPVPLPFDMIQGVDLQKLDFERGFPSYLRGEWSDHGWWYYYFYALLIKTPLGTLGLFALAIGCTIIVRTGNASWRDEMVILLPGITILAFVSSQAGFSIHSRYVIPALPFFFVWMSKVGKAFELKHRALSTVIVFLLAWSIGSSLWVYPHSISYFNELAAVLPTPKTDENYPSKVHQKSGFMDAGPCKGPKHLLDSNIDWGQDLFFLEKWCQEHPEAKNIYLAYSGSYPVEQTKIPSLGMPSVDERPPGWYAISVNYLYGREKVFNDFLQREPVARIGYSIRIYRIKEEDLKRIYSSNRVVDVE